MREGVAERVSMAQRRQDYNAAHEWLSSPLPGTEETAAGECAAALEAAKVADDCASPPHEGLPPLAGVTAQR